MIDPDPDKTLISPGTERGHACGGYSEREDSDAGSRTGQLFP